MVWIALTLMLSFLGMVSSSIAIFLFTKLISTRRINKKVEVGDAIIISGCDSGIGFEITKHFLKTTKLKIICGFLDPDKSDGFQKLKELNSHHRLLLLKLDLTSADDIDFLANQLKQWQNQGDISKLVALINNAGTMTFGEFDWLTWEQIQRQIDVNLTGTVRLTRAIVPYIIESKGRIINVSSVNDSIVFPGLSIYSASKSALSIFSRGLGYEMRKFGAHVVTIRLGDFARLTNIMANHKSYSDDMWNRMTMKKKNIYKDFFHQFNQHILENYGMTSPQNFAQSSLFDDFDKALLSHEPPNTIVCASLTFKMFYFVIEFMPIWLQYYMLDVMFKFGFQWKAPQILV